MNTTNTEVVAAMLHDLSTRSWAAMGRHFSDDAHHADMGTPGPGVVGGAAIAERMGIVLDPLDEYELLPGTVTVAEGDIVVSEIKERWRFRTGEELVHPWVSVAELSDGRIVRWHCYSNAGNVADNAPASFMQEVAERFMATGTV
jgi:ketosteroid isomerase-like protein